ncbi:hypothetical protein FSP39_001560 [Pinctada imbricata]|uniref:C2H2-type domain-containing protein n=1 Tax=Pinctada imbricata TaxID=66713 RepID=A0AA89BZN2_PINIB|nr:hypothetical protein FSP39_001560 [Pinctada imbricata]
MMLCIYCQRRDFENTRERVEHELVCQKKKTTLKPILPKSNPKLKSTFSGEVESSVSQLSSTPKFKPKVSTKNKVGTVIMQPSVSLRTLVEFPCGKCSKKFVTPESLESHKEKEHSRPELFPCHLCGLTYESQQSMRRHLKMTHEGRRNVYPCLMCRKKGIKKQFSNRLVLEKHLMAKHKITKSKLTSNIVPEYPDEEDSILPPPPPIPSVVKRKADLKAVTDDSPIKRLRVAGDQLFNCAKCSFSCEDRTKFLEHLKEHNISNTIQCLECGLCFAIVQSLRKHLFMVHKIKDFEKYCVDEGLEFKEEEVDLIIQESHSDSENISHDEEDREHSGDPLECRVCYRKFEDQAKLRSHMRNHGMAFIRNRRRERTNSLKTSPSKSVNGNESSDSSVSTA